ncbi:MAG: YidC/Oxa1 family membrane protein insertase, partial [Patescibacteria group bacterium]
MEEIFNTILIDPIINVLVFLYKTLFSISAPYPLGLSIIILTIVVKLITHPLTASQFKSMAKLRKLQPHLDKVKEKYGQDKARLQQETMKLYKEHGVNPAGGCFPLLIQFPIFIALYQ